MRNNLTKGALMIFQKIEHRKVEIPQTKILDS